MMIWPAITAVVYIGYGFWILSKVEFVFQPEDEVQSRALLFLTFLTYCVIIVLTLPARHIWYGFWFSLDWLLTTTGLSEPDDEDDEGAETHWQQWQDEDWSKW